MAYQGLQSKCIVGFISFFNASFFRFGQGSSLDVANRHRHICDLKYSTNTQSMNVAVDKSNVLEPQKADLHVEQISQVLSLLPACEGKTVLELYKGKSEFTDELTKKTTKVLSIDPIKETIVHKQVENMSSITSLVSNSIDLVFVNQLFKHLGEQEVEQLVGLMGKWLKPGGLIFFREPCLPLIEDHMLHKNSIHHHEPQLFLKVFSKWHMSKEYGESYRLSHIYSKCTEADVRSRENQICWLWKKNPNLINDKDVQQFLEASQYNRKFIRMAERVLGEGTLSPGGIEVVKDFITNLELKPMQKVLDVGCGIGGADFYIAEQFNVEVVGVDLSTDIISLALERAITQNCTVQFMLADCTKLTYPDNSFDAIYSSGVLLHVHDKPTLFRSFYKWLKPGGKLLISDYCKSGGASSSGFMAYVERFKYDLHEVQVYGQMLKEAGFDEVIAEDKTDQLYEISKKELQAVQKEEDKFIKDFSKESYDDIIQLWKGKITRCREGEQRWGFFLAKKKDIY